jgi:hypothetical protein
MGYRLNQERRDNGMERTALRGAADAERVTCKNLGDEIETCNAHPAIFHRLFFIFWYLLVTYGPNV